MIAQLLLLLHNFPFSTRPLLSNIEKKWIAFQLLRALDDGWYRKVCCYLVSIATNQMIYSTSPFQRYPMAT